MGMLQKVSVLVAFSLLLIGPSAFFKVHADTNSNSMVDHTAQFRQLFAATQNWPNPLVLEKLIYAPKQDLMNEQNFVPTESGLCSAKTLGKLGDTGPMKLGRSIL